MAFCKDPVTGAYTTCGDNGDAATDGPGVGDNYVLMPDSSTVKYVGSSLAPMGKKPVKPEQAYASVFAMKKEDQRRLERYYSRLADKWRFESTRSMWSMAVDAAANSDQTPWDVLEAAATNKVEAPASMATAGSGGSGGGPYRREAVDFTNETSARSLVDRALGDYLGRAATDKEAAKFYATLTKAQQANPVVEQGYASGSGSATSTREGGVLPEQLAKDFAMSRDDYAEVQVETTAKSLIEQAIRQAGQNRII